MFLRSPIASDLDQLDSLNCANQTASQREVEDWVRKQLRGWFNASRGNECRVLVDDDFNPERVVGLYAFETGFDDGKWFVNMVARRRDYKGQGVGQVLLTNCLQELGERSPGGSAWWKVKPDNDTSHALSLRSGAEAEPTAEGSKKCSQYFTQLYDPSAAE